MIHLEDMSSNDMLWVEGWERISDINDYKLSELKKYRKQHMTGNPTAGLKKNPNNTNKFANCTHQENPLVKNI